jgi:diguanylate cyclase (GGDEF)-like protein
VGHPRGEHEHGPDGPEAARLAPAQVAVLCVGVDGLKTVNEALTHEAGDHLVAVLATRIAACVVDGDLVGRGTGDEFLVLVPDLADRADASIAAEHVRLRPRGWCSSAPTGSSPP